MKVLHIRSCNYTILVSYIYQGDIFILNHLVLEHLSGVKGGFPLEEAYYLKLSLFQGIEYFF
jgi:hypothetical protein